MSREPGAGSREPEAGSRKPEAGSRKPEAGSRKPEAGSRKDTVQVLRRVLAVVRNLTALNRVVDVLPVFADDLRIQVVFAIDRGSKFHHGVEHQLHAAGMRIIGWDEALASRFDLALSASDRGELDRISAPLVLLLHGVGYHRIISTQDGRGREIPGLTGAVRLHARRSQPSTLVVGHPGQVETMRRVSAAAAASAIVAGDPCLDRMLASHTRQVSYRTAMRAEHRRLVLVNSTWGPHALLGTHPELPARLLSELPADEYRVAAVLHPNVWSRHGPWQVRAWLSRAVDAGLVLVPPDEGWRAALVAAHLVVSDHGSITSYAAALDKPLLIAADGANEVVSDSPLAGLLRSATRLDHTAPLLEQIQDVVHRHRRHRSRYVAELMFARRSESLGLLQDEMYRLMRLPRPHQPARSRPLPMPAIEVREPLSFVVRTSVTRRTKHSTSVTVQRFPAVLEREMASGPGSEHLVVDDSEPDAKLAESAAIVFRRSSAPTDAEVATWLDDAVARYPGSRIAAAISTGRAVLRLRDGTEVTAQCEGATGVDTSVCVSAIYACLVAGIVLPELRVVDVQVGGATAIARLEVNDHRRLTC